MTKTEIEEYLVKLEHKLQPLIAPPFPRDKLFLKMEFIIVTFPSLKNKPPPALSTPPVELSSKTLLVNVKLEFTFIFIAPPLMDDSLFPLNVMSRTSYKCRGFI